MLHKCHVTLACVHICVQSKLINPAVLQYTIQSVHRYQRYNVYVIAASQHGASPASELFELVADDCKSKLFFSVMHSDALLFITMLFV